MKDTTRRFASELQEALSSRHAMGRTMERATWLEYPSVLLAAATAFVCTRHYIDETFLRWGGLTAGCYWPFRIFYLMVKDEYLDTKISDKWKKIYAARNEAKLMATFYPNQRAEKISEGNKNSDGAARAVAATALSRCEPLRSKPQLRLIQGGMAPKS